MTVPMPTAAQYDEPRPERPRGGVVAEMDELAAVVGSLEKVTLQLREVLEPVLRQSVPTPPTGERHPAPEPASPLAGQIRETTAGLAALVNVLGSTLSRLDLQ